MVFAGCCCVASHCSWAIRMLLSTVEDTHLDGIIVERVKVSWSLGYAWVVPVGLVEVEPQSLESFDIGNTSVHKIYKLEEHNKEQTASYKKARKQTRRKISDMHASHDFRRPKGGNVKSKAELTSLNGSRASPVSLSPHRTYSIVALLRMDNPVLEQSLRRQSGNLKTAWRYIA